VDSRGVLRLGSTTVKRQRKCEKGGMGASRSMPIRRWASEISAGKLTALGVQYGGVVHTDGEGPKQPVCEKPMPRACCEQEAPAQ